MFDAVLFLIYGLLVKYTDPLKVLLNKASHGLEPRRLPGVFLLVMKDPSRRSDYG